MAQQRANLADTGPGQLGDRRQGLAALLHPRNCRGGFGAMVNALAVGLSANLVTDLGQPFGLPGIDLTDLAHGYHQRRGVINVGSFPLCARLIGPSLCLPDPPPRLDLRSISSHAPHHRSRSGRRPTTTATFVPSRFSRHRHSLSARLTPSSPFMRSAAPSPTPPFVSST